jgi:hypothetical protein
VIPNRRTVLLMIESVMARVRANLQEMNVLARSQMHSSRSTKNWEPRHAKRQRKTLLGGHIFCNPLCM